MSHSGLPDLDVIALQADLVGGDGIVGDTALLGLAGPDVERRGVPGVEDQGSRRILMALITSADSQKRT